MSYDWRKDPAAWDEYDRRHRTTIIVPVETETEVERGRFEPALWINPDNTRPRRDWGSN